MTNHTFYTLGEAAKATGKAKGTIKNAISKGRLSAQKNDKGEYSIDPAELHRVYKPLPTEQEQLNTVTPPSITGVTQAEKDALEAQIELLKQTVEDLRGDRDRWAKQAEVLALTDQRPQGGFFKKLFG
jgi:polyhydroxyalkanoate synthesis regulator phasin